MGLLKRLGKFAKKVVDFEKENIRHIGGGIKDDPSRLLKGAIDPFGSKLWGYDEGLVNQLGGATDEAYSRAEAKGVDTGPGRSMHQLATAIAGTIAGGYGAGKLGALRNAGTLGSQTGSATVSGTNAAMGATPMTSTAGALQDMTALVGPQAGAQTGVKGLMSRAADMAGDYFLNPDGTKNWGNIIKGGTLAAGAVGALGAGGGEGATHPPMDPGPPLQLMSMQRRRSPLSEQAYRSYGRGPGAAQHRFFSDPTFASVDGTLVPGSKEPVPLDNREVKPLRVMAAKGGSPQAVKGDGSGRDDTVEALLSDGEYVMDAETVALLGDGSVDEGAKRLDKMRVNLRRHKGRQLAKGKFSSNAKDPESYLPKSKGGQIRRVIKGGVKATTRERLAQAEHVRRVAELLAKRTPESGHTAEDWVKTFEEWGTPGSGSGRRVGPLERKARGGAVYKGPAFREMIALADKFERALRIGDRKVALSTGKSLDAMSPGSSGKVAAQFAKGGSVARVLRQIKAALEPPPSRIFPPDSTELPPVADTQPKDVDDMMRALERLEPRSGVFRQYRAEQDRRAQARRTPDRRDRKALGGMARQDTTRRF